MDEVRELDGVADEEHRGVVADEVVVALGGVELQREAARVAPGVGGALLAGDAWRSGRACRSWCRAGTGRPWCRRETSSVVSKTPNAPAPLACDDALRDALAVEVRHLVQEVHVVQQDRAVGGRGQGVAVADGRRAGARWSSRARPHARCRLDGLGHRFYFGRAVAEGYAGWLGMRGRFPRRSRSASSMVKPCALLGFAGRAPRRRAVDVRDGAARAADDVVVVVAHASSRTGRGSRRLDPPGEAGVGEARSTS